MGYIKRQGFDLPFSSQISFISPSQTTRTQTQTSSTSSQTGVNLVAITTQLSVNATLTVESFPANATAYITTTATACTTFLTTVTNTIPSPTIVQTSLPPLPDQTDFQNAVAAGSQRNFILVVVFGGVIVLLLIALAIIFCIWARRRRKNRYSNNESSIETPQLNLFPLPGASMTQQNLGRTPHGRFTGDYRGGNSPVNPGNSNSPPRGGDSPPGGENVPVIMIQPHTPGGLAVTTDADEKERQPTIPWPFREVNTQRELAEREEELAQMERERTRKEGLSLDFGPPFIKNVRREHGERGRVSSVYSDIGLEPVRESGESNRGTRASSGVFPDGMESTDEGGMTGKEEGWDSDFRKSMRFSS
jgi:hypothetical protein